jgi:hypothetical protein
LHVPACSKEAFNMLANELLGFVRRQYTGVMDVSADSVGDDVYTWSVEMWKSAFKPDCQLAKVRQRRGELAPISTEVVHHRSLMKFHGRSSPLCVQACLLLLSQPS